jgi:protein-S-isoprenylcysteine O-methyltransferase Ste14
MDDSEIVARLIKTAALWTLWCVVHSSLNSEGIVRKTVVVDTWFRRYYRLLYVLFAVVSLILVWWLTPFENSISLLKWNGIFFVVRIVATAVAVAIFYLTFRQIGLLDFLGFTALGIVRKAAVSSNQLITWGIYGRMRHPQFFAGLLLLWARDLTDTDLVINIVLSSYLLIGSQIEERRLLKKFGEEYARYREEVPSFLPKMTL